MDWYTASGAGPITSAVLTVEVVVNSFPVLKYSSATKVPVAPPPASICTTALSAVADVSADLLLEPMELVAEIL